MLYLLLFLLSFIMIITYIVLDRDLFAPAFIVSSVFFVSTVGCIINEKYWGTRLSIDTVIVITGGCLIFTMVSVVCKVLSQKLHVGKFSNRLFELKEIRIDHWKIICIILVNIMLIYLQIKFVDQIASLSSKSLISWGLKMEYYRNVVSYDSSNLHISIPSYINILNKCTTFLAYVFVYISVNNFLVHDNKPVLKRINIWNVIPIMGYMLFNLICAVRGGILQIFIATITTYHLLYHKQKGWGRKYSLKSMVKILALVFLLLVAFVFLRDVVGRNYSETARNPIYYVCCYIGGSIHLLDDFIKNPPVHSGIWGEETFYSIIRFLVQRLGISDWIYVSHLEFRISNGLNVGNVYTAFRKYIYDFGYFGMCCCTALVSLIYSSIYYSIRYGRKKEKTFDIKIMFFAYISYGYYYMSIQEQTLSTILCITTLFSPFLFMIMIYFLNIPIVFRKRVTRIENGGVG